MTPTHLADFESTTTAQGYDPLIERRWEPLSVVDTHTHPFAAKAVLTQGEMWLTCGDETQHLLAGDAFELAANVPHAERYGPAGATYWVARRAA